MKIREVEVFRQAIPLHKPFRTALRTVTVAESVLVRLTADDGRVGWGEAPATLAITGDSLPAIEAAIRDTMRPLLVGQSVLAHEALLQAVNRSMIGNTSAKAAVDMAVYDLLGQQCGLPLYQLLGGAKDELETDFTVSVGAPVAMGEDAVEAVAGGFQVLKIKVGKDSIERDLERIREVRQWVGPEITIRLDANQGWQVKEAIRSIRQMEEEGLGIELVEQPVHALDLDGLKAVTDAVDTPIMADESVFSPRHALEVLKRRAADLINIKLMKTGGLYKALRVNAIAEEYGVECMIGSMIESRVAVTAAAHLAAAQKNITRFDLDAPLLLAADPVEGGVCYTGRRIAFPAEPGLGIRGVILTSP
ncbi:dipeptide epimerase [Gorillibacterium sp. CAU 1737]|uniref:mandelate racemase/muconate lactonizing enzyme family protein n=1 Tax=Gorillibacterium sp. CAU 1737 TaxID=3140362 RepID=UPI00326001E2